MKKVVIKIGSSVIAPGGSLDAGLINRIVKDICKAEQKGFKVVLVSSGAIACGLSVLGYKKRPADTHALMAISAIGQIVLMDVFNAKLKKYRKKCAQVLLTWDDFDNRRRFMNIKKTLDKLLDMGVIPVINENDVVSYEEIRFGDNDRLSALVADLVGAQDLIILSDVEGLLSKDALVREVRSIDESVVSLARKEDKEYTSGGMITKLEAARLAVTSGIKTVIAYGRKNSVISKLLEGAREGTVFYPYTKKEKARKRWISQKMIKGSITIDEGARDALINKGKSLLNVGVAGVKGPFKKGDAVAVLDTDDNYLGCGIVNFSFEELEKSAKAKLGKEVIHRNDFVKASLGWCYYSHTKGKGSCSK